VKPIPKTTWKALDGKAKWDCMVALRGPDCNDPEHIKWFTTAIIRQRLRIAIRVGGLVNERLGCIIIPDLYSIIASPFSLVHFIQHTREAANILEIPVLRIKYELWDAAIQTAYQPQTAVRFYKAIVAAFPGSQSPAQIELRRHIVEDCGLLSAVGEIEKGVESV